MIKQIVMSEEEYTELTSKEVKANIFLKQRVEELEAELSKYKIFKAQMEQESDRLAEEVKENTVISDVQELVSVYNSLCKSKGIKSVKQADAAFIDYLDIESTKVDDSIYQINNTSDIKAFRSLLSNKLSRYRTAKVRGIIQLLEI